MCIAYIIHVHLFRCLFSSLDYYSFCICCVYTRFCWLFCFCFYFFFFVYTRCVVVSFLFALCFFFCFGFFFLQLSTRWRLTWQSLSVGSILIWLLCVCVCALALLYSNDEYLIWRRLYTFDICCMAHKTYTHTHVHETLIFLYLPADYGTFSHIAKEVTPYSPAHVTILSKWLTQKSTTKNSGSLFPTPFFLFFLLLLLFFSGQLNNNKWSYENEMNASYTHTTNTHKMKEERNEKNTFRIVLVVDYFNQIFPEGKLPLFV